jgi:hypothetical protein
MNEQLPIPEGERAADDDSLDTHEDNEAELDAVFGEPDEMEGEDEGDSGTDEEPAGEQS